MFDWKYWLYLLIKQQFWCVRPTQDRVLLWQLRSLMTSCLTFTIQRPVCEKRPLNSSSSTRQAGRKLTLQPSHSFFTFFTLTLTLTESSCSSAHGGTFVMVFWWRLSCLLSYYYIWYWRLRCLDIVFCKYLLCNSALHTLAGALPEPRSACGC